MLLLVTVSVCNFSLVTKESMKWKVLYALEPWRFVKELNFGLKNRYLFWKPLGVASFDVNNLSIKYTCPRFSKKLTLDQEA